MGTREQIANSVTTTLDGGINDVTNTIVVNDGSVFPSDGNFVVRIESELIRATARSGNTLTGTRGYAGSTADSHGTGADVVSVVEAANVEQFIREAGDQKFLNHSSDDWPQRHRLVDSNGNTVVDSDWTIVSANTNNDDLAWGGHHMAPAPIIGIRLQPAVKSQPNTPYTITGRVAMDNCNDYGTSANLTGICLRESSSGKIMSLYMRTGDRLSMTTWSNPTTVNAEIAQIDWGRRLDSWMRFTNDGVDIEGFASCDGVNWVSIGTESVGSYLTPNQIGWFGANRQGTGHHFFLLSWLET